MGELMGDRTATHSKAILCGYYGKGNGGDEALLATLLQMLPPTVQPIVMSGNPQDTFKRYQVQTCDRTSAFRILDCLQQSDYFIWGGGSLMQDVTSLASPIYYGGLMALAQQRGLKTIAWAQGIGPLKRPFTQWLTRQVLQGCHAISVRDAASAQLLSQWGINAALAPDPVWALEATAPPVSLDSPIIAVNLRPHPTLTQKRLQHLSQALARLQATTESLILFVPFQKSQDLPLAEAIAPQLPGKHQILTLEDPRQLKGLFNQVQFTIGMRLHTLIMAAAQSSPCFALSYDPKVTQLMHSLNLPGWELSQLPDNPDTLYETWLTHYHAKTPLSPNKIQALRDAACLHQQLLWQVIN
ncbi:polysaccharide pyruvyl transferase CsaB [Spirulina subsalsa FACHB-351]|uniref:Polysaccharide pyruvyl transferase CsaB n=1 Tax=Spirulina subsalsa FACHB-351 TaxID=234711 RepID=A0ABT3L4Q9_9CYAN|nr:polysaccharide pyruvyl transferase CsaB [Spirulina subsalsa]MCW6036496.1 polysaccharide pyruvyl transferase CsaB [Spirulina subsalsa FACHB-351]